MVAGENDLNSFFRGVLVAIFFGLCFWIGLAFGFAEK